MVPCHISNISLYAGSTANDLLTSEVAFSAQCDIRSSASHTS